MTGTVWATDRPTDRVEEPTLQLAEMGYFLRRHSALLGRTCP